MLTIKDISFSIAGMPLFTQANACIPQGHKVGIIGRNGTGKTTLFKLITGQLILDDGEINFPQKLRIGCITQEAPASDISLIDTVLETDTQRNQLLEEAQTATDPKHIGHIHERLADIDAYSAPARAATILSGLGFNDGAQKRACCEFSGGWRMRIALACILFSQPDLLLLDEPTNYLDIKGTLWLENYLRRYPHTILMISHDRTLLNSCVNSILHLENRQLTYYQGNYDVFNKVRHAEIAKQQAHLHKQDKKRAHLQSFIDRFRAKASKAKQAQSRIKMLEKMHPIASRVENQVASFYFPKPDPLSPPILRLENINVGYDDKTILWHLNLRIDENDRIALLGENGQGKSTLSKLLANNISAQTGQIIRSSKLRIGYFAQHQVDELILHETPLEHVTRALPTISPSQVRARLAKGGITSQQVNTAVKQLSGGQKARLSLLLITLNAPHLLILDEPTNHLDIESREALIFALTAYQGAIVLVSHDQYLINAIADRLWLVNDGTVMPYDDDLNTYKRMILSGKTAQNTSQRPPQTHKAKPISQSDIRKFLAPFEADVQKCENRIEKIQNIHKKLNAEFSDATLYNHANKNQLQILINKKAEIEAAFKKAEKLWLLAEEKLEEAKSKLQN